MIGRQSMLKDHGHEFFNDGVLLCDEALQGWVGWIGRRVLAFEFLGKGENFLLGDESFLFEQFPKGCQGIGLSKGLFAWTGTYQSPP